MSWVEELRRLLRRVRGERPREDLPEGIPCEAAMERLFEWLDGELDDPVLESQVGAHLETCARCYPRLVFERAFREAVARAARDGQAPEDLRDRILNSLETEGFTAP